MWHTVETPQSAPLKNRHHFILALLGTLLLLLRAAPVLGLDMTWNAAADVPVTAASYTASGNVNFTLNFVPATGTNLTAVNNTGLPFITGRFDNLTQGQTVALSYGGITYHFIANYYGGTGNDLVLVWKNNRAYGWGTNAQSQLGNPSILGSSKVPVPLTGILAGKTVIALSSGVVHGLALCSDGTVAAWGNNDQGQLGDNSTTTRATPVAVNIDSGISALFGKTVIAISAGSHHSLALCSDGTVAAWGANANGQLGNGNIVNQPAPVSVSTASGVSALFGKTVVRIAAGSIHSLALCSDGTIVAWGDNLDGQLGDNTTINRQVPVSVNAASGISALFGRTVIAIAAGLGHSLALCSDGTAVAWGRNDDGQVGDNSVTNRIVPVAVSTTLGTSALHGKTPVSIAAGGLHSLALCSDGAVATWGSNSDGQLGDGQLDSTYVMATFHNNRQRLQIGVSMDGKSWTMLSKNGSNDIYSPPGGDDLRDPSIARIGGTWYVVYTSGDYGSAHVPPISGHFGNSEAYFGLAKSTDLLNWTWVANVPIASTTQVWGPQLVQFASGQIYVFVSVNGTIKFLTPTDNSLAAWSSATPVSGLPLTASGYNLGPEWRVTEANGAWYAATSYEQTLGEGTIVTFLKSTTSPVSGYQLINATNITGLPTNQVEGPNLTHLGGNSFRLYYCAIENNERPLRYMDTSDDLATWTAPVLATHDSPDIITHAGLVLDLESTGLKRLAPVAVNTTSGVSAIFGKTVMSVAGGGRHSVAFCRDETAVTWGRGSLGQLGNDTDTSARAPVRVTTASIAATEHLAAAFTGEESDDTFAIVAGPQPADTNGPINGTITMTPASPVNLLTNLTVAFANWTDPAGMLTYAVRIDSGLWSGLNSSDTINNLDAPFTPGIHTLTGRIYDAFNNVTEVTQSFTVNTPQETWRMRFYGTTSNTGNAADTADPYHKGMQNLAVFSLLGPNQDPQTASITQFPRMQRSGGNLFYSFTQPLGVGGVTYGAEWRTDLLPGLWTPIADTGTGTTHTFSVPIGDRTQMFIRLRLNSP